MSKMDTIETSFKHMLSFKARIKSQITDDTGSCFEYPEISSIGEIYTSLAQKMRYSLPKTYHASVEASLEGYLHLVLGGL